MPGEMEIIEGSHAGKNGSNQKFVGGSRKLLQLFRLKPLWWRSKQTGVGKEQKQSPDERRDQLDRDMKNNWDQLPATLRRRKEKLSQAVLDQFTEDITPVEDEIKAYLHPDLEGQNTVVQKVSDDSIHASPVEDAQLSDDKQSREPLGPELDSASAESLKISSSSSQIIVRPEIHRECSDSSLEFVENTADDLDFELSDNGHTVLPGNQATGFKGETEAEAQTVVKIQTDSRDKVSEHNTETNKPTHTEAQFKNKSVTQPESENTTQETELLTATCSKEIVPQNSSHSTSVVDSYLTPREKHEISLLNKNGNCIDQNENLDDNSDKNKTDLSHTEMIVVTSDAKKSEKCDSNDIDLKSKNVFKLFLPNESYLYSSGHKDKNMSVHCDISTSPTNSKLPATKEFNQESPRRNTFLSHEEQQVMALLSRAVSEDSLLVPSSPSSTSASSVTSSVDERIRDSGTDINSPSPSTSSSSVESVSTITSRELTDTTLHYKIPKNLLKSVEKLNEDNKVDAEEIMKTSIPVSQEIDSAMDSGIEKSLGSQSTGNNSSLSSSSSTTTTFISDTGKNCSISKHNERTPTKFPIDSTSSAKFQTLSSSTNGCFSSLSDDPSLYEVVIPRAEYHKPSHMALKTIEYQAPTDKFVHEMNHDVVGYSTTSPTKDKLAYDDIHKTHIHPTKSPAKIESLQRDEEDVMSYYDAVLQEGQIPNNKDCDKNRDDIGNGSVHLKLMKAVMDGKEYEYIAKGLYINDYVHVEMKNQKSVCNGRSENRYVGTGNAFAKRYAAMEFAKPVTSSTDLSRDNTFAKGAVDCKDKMLLPDTPGNTWKRPFGLETLNKKPMAMATIMEEREGEADINVTTPNAGDSEKLTVREILRRFEELGGHVQLPTDITQVEGDSDVDKSATLRDIQETLRCLEEKVRHYETKAITTQTQESDENDAGEKLQQKAVPHIPDGVATPKIALDGWTGHIRNTVHQQSAVLHSHTNTTPTQQPHHHQQHTVITSSPQPAEPPGHHDGKHSLLQFAMLHFRQSPEKFEMLKTADGSISGSLKVIESLKANKKNKGKKGNKDNDWTWKEQVDLVKFSSVPIEQSLLRLEPGELSELAVECFAAVMRYMGDLPMAPDSTEVKCVYTILMHCHKHEALRDEVYCQLMKQTTNNKSIKPDSCQRGWRLFSIVAAYFVCSDTLKPYLFKYLETAAYDKRRAYHGTATVCLQNLRKTFKYGGRKNVPSVEEITAISAGRNSKRQIYRLPGGTERVVNTKSTTVVQDVIEELCSVIGVAGGEMEMEEFSLYCIVEGDTFTMPLAREEYILDVTTELHKNQQVFYLIFCRSVWHFPLRLDSQLYVEVVFNQIAPDYLEGLLLIMPGEQLDQDVIYDIAKMAALLHRAADMTHVPTMKETKFLLPKPALTVRDVKPAQWVNMVQSNWRDVETLTTIQAKAQVLDILSKWPLFGSSFFAVKRVSDPKERSDHILALNRHGVHFIDLITHETLTHYPFSEVISTRKVKSEDGTLFLDMKCGNLMQQRITRLQTDQAHEISRLIRQYITMEQRLQQRSAA